MFEIMALANSEMPQVKLLELMDINNQSGYYNLTLSKDDVLKLVSARNVHLKYAERIEFGFETLEAIINIFYKSPYINQFEYTDILSELQFIFYILKNEVGEALTDEELITLMAELFDGVCAGSLELLKGRGAEYIQELAKEIRLNSENDWNVAKNEVSRLEVSGGGIILSYSGTQEAELRYSLSVILEELSMKYTKGRSFSIKAETAQSIVKTVLYMCGIMGEKETGVDKLRVAYYKGIEAIEGILAEAKLLYAKAKQTKPEIELASYNLSIDNIAIFFDNYDKEFAVAEIPAEISYFPVLCDRRLEGAEFIRDYLSCIIFENEVCRLFDKGDIELLLTVLEEKEEKGRSLLAVNVFEIVLTNSLFAIISGKPPTSLTLTVSDETAIKHRLNDIGVIDETVNSFLYYFELEEETGLSEYIKKFVFYRLKPQIKASDGNPAEIAVFSSTRPRHFLTPGEKMPAETFRELIYYLNNENDLENKIKIIRKNINSLYDLIDLFNADVFSGNEYKLFFGALYADELQTLWDAVKYVLREGEGNEVYADAISGITPETAWVKELFEFKEGCLKC